MSSMTTKRLSLEIEVEKHKDSRGKIRSYSARYFGGTGGCTNGQIEACGSTEQAAIENLKARIALVVDGLGRVEIASDATVDWHAITLQLQGGGFAYQFLNVVDGRVSLRSSCNCMDGTFDQTRRAMHEHLRSLTHCCCYLCRTEIPNASAIYYATTIESRMGLTGNHPYYVCNACEDKLGGALGALAALRDAIGARDPHPLVRCGAVAPDGTHPPIPGAAQRTSRVLESAA